MQSQADEFQLQLSKVAAERDSEHERFREASERVKTRKELQTMLASLHEMTSMGSASTMDRQLEQQEALDKLSALKDAEKNAALEALKAEHASTARQLLEESKGSKETVAAREEAASLKREAQELREASTG